jgi:PAS domain S-box-containing protein
MDPTLTAERTHRTLAEHHAETAAKYRSLVEQLPCVVYLAEFGVDGDWLYISPQLERVLGFTQHEWLEHPHPQRSFTHPQDLPLVVAAEERSLQTGELRVEYRIQRRDGTWIWVLDEAIAVRAEDGRPICLQGLIFDITERREAEERLIALDRLKNTLLHTLSHDLKEPLTAILIAASTLQRLSDELTEDERQHMLATLVGRTKGINALLTDLLDLERLDSGIVEPRRFPMDVGVMVRRLVCRMDSLSRRDVIVDEGECRAELDAPKFERIVENLLANAVRHTPDAGRIWVRFWREGDTMTLAVEDEGPGVPPELRERIFESFVRGSNAEGVPGSGIGLSLVARFAELHGGSAWVEDREGGGASFRVRLADGGEPLDR